MVQHINLLTRTSSSKNLSLTAFRVGIILLVLVVFWSAYKEFKLQRMQLDNDFSQEKLLHLNSELKQNRKDAGLEDAQRLSKDSAVIRQTLESQDLWMQAIQNGGVGSLQGHSALLHNFAKLSQPSVWLQTIEISQSGQSIGVTGVAHQTRDVMTYASDLNKSLEAMNIELKSLEISKNESTEGDLSQQNYPLVFKLK